MATTKAAIAKIRKWLLARHAISKAEREKKALEIFVREAVGSAPDRAIEVGTQTVSLIAVSGGRRLNMAAAERGLGKKSFTQFYRDVQLFDQPAAVAALGEKLDPFWEDLPGYDRLIVK